MARIKGNAWRKVFMGCVIVSCTQNGGYNIYKESQYIGWAATVPSAEDLCREANRG